ncbi:MAG: trehalose-phosphatase [Hyphomicrobiaceae bacterium]|nr:trehalose-phosphatase [Hyphomicrobiaceae bacterium]
MRTLDTTTHALFLDFDGTLVEIAETPDSIEVPADLVPALTRLSSALNGALAINTGRPICEIDRFLFPLRLPASGIHGAEIRAIAGGTIESNVPPLDPALLSAVFRLEKHSPAIIVEPKRFSVAVHYRSAPDLAGVLEKEMQAIVDDEPDHLALAHGRKVLEIVPKDVSKGAALAHLMRLPAFLGRRPIMVGDDISDQPAFEEAERLGGIALRVAGELHPATLADFAGPSRVRTWLLQSLETCEG